jgi:AraC family transcriptional regulator
MPSDREIRQVLQRVNRRLFEDASLTVLGQRAGWSPFHLHRAFRNSVGETPKAYVQRLRLERGASLLLTSDRAVVDIAFACGFASHESFTRAFRRHFGVSPRLYRSRQRGHGESHAHVTGAVGPCIRLFGPSKSERRSVMTQLPEISLVELEEQPILFIRKRCAAGELQTALAECLPRVYAYCQQNAVPLAGHPFTRYVAVELGSFTIEAGMPVRERVAGEGEIEAGALPGGRAAVAIHRGAYERLPETYGAVQSWIDQHGHASGGAPWEVYLTDPAEVPDENQWETRVVFPVRD